jgi:hypothetical protein
MASLIVTSNSILIGNIYRATAKSPSPQDPPSTQIYLPLVVKPALLLPIINVPQFGGFQQAAVFWFGQVRDNENYAEVRVEYNDSEINVDVAVFDRYLWYNPTPTVDDLTSWDAVSLYLNTDIRDGDVLDSSYYRFVGQLNWWETRNKYQAAYQGNSSGWNLAPISFTTESGWRGNAPNDTKEDRGYRITYHIPFSSLGLSGPPLTGTKWGIAVTVHDRDDASGVTLANINWPQNFDTLLSSTWGQLSFGFPTFTTPHVTPTQTVTIRNGLNGSNVLEDVVGGNTLCGDGLDFWNQWGDYSYPSVRDMNVQNQWDVADWPCFSKIYLTFPLDSLPLDKVVISATLTLHQSGQATGFPDEPPEAVYSLIQVFQVDKDWNEATLTWNNAPMVLENVSRSWVGPITMADYGIARNWDVSGVVAKAYAAGQPLRLALYSADSYGPHGKYFLSSNVGSYEQNLMPTLKVVLGDP